MNTAICVFGTVTKRDQIEKIRQFIAAPNPSCDIFVHSYSSISRSAFDLLRPFEIEVDPIPPRKSFPFQKIHNKELLPVQELNSLLQVNRLRRTVQSVAGFNYHQYLFVDFSCPFAREIDTTELVYKDAILVDPGFMAKKMVTVDGISFMPFSLKLFTTTDKIVSSLECEPLAYDYSRKFLGSNWQERWTGHFFSVVRKIPVSSTKIR